MRRILGLVFLATVCLLVVGVQAQAHPLVSSCVGYWPLTADWSDTSGFAEPVQPQSYVKLVDIDGQGTMMCSTRVDQYARVGRFLAKQDWEAANTAAYGFAFTYYPSDFDYSNGGHALYAFREWLKVTATTPSTSGGTTTWGVAGVDDAGLVAPSQHFFVVGHVNYGADDARVIKVYDADTGLLLGTHSRLVNSLVNGPLYSIELAMLAEHCIKDVTMWVGPRPTGWDEGDLTAGSALGTQLRHMWNGGSCFSSLCGAQDGDGVCEDDEEGCSDCDGFCDIGDTLASFDCDGLCRAGDVAGSVDCDGVCDASEAPDSPDCDQTCSAGETAGPDCNGMCDMNEPLGPNGDCTGGCESGDPAITLVCDKVCGPLDDPFTVEWEDCDNVCDTAAEFGTSDCGCDGDGSCELLEDGDGACVADCDSVCDVSDVIGSVDCGMCDGNGACAVGEGGDGACVADCDGACNIGDAAGSIDCDGVCDEGDEAGSVDCNGVCGLREGASVDCDGTCDVGETNSCDCGDTDCRAVAALETALLVGFSNGAAALPDWVNGDPCGDTWSGVTCDGASPANVQTVELSGAGLQGSISEALGVQLLPLLNTLDLSDNLLTGTVPDALVGVGSLLDSLQVNGNALSGTIPASLRHMQVPATLALHDNAFTGAMPDLSAIAAGLSLTAHTNSLGASYVPDWIDATVASAHLWETGDANVWYCDFPTGCPAFGAACGNIGANCVVCLGGNDDGVCEGAELCKTDCDGVCAAGELLGVLDCDGVCATDGSEDASVDCDGVCASDGSEDASVDCDGVCAVGEEGSADCDGVCDAGEAGSADCDSVCDAGERGSPDCNCDGDDTCGVGEDGIGACSDDCDGGCNPGDAVGSVDCDASCDAGERGSVDCNCDGDDVCSAGEDGVGACSLDCDGGCNLGDALASVDCNGVCDGTDTPPSVDCPCDNSASCEEGEWYDGSCGTTDCDGVCTGGTDAPGSVDCLEQVSVLLDSVPIVLATLQSDLIAAVPACAPNALRAVSQAVDTFDTSTTLARIDINTQACFDAMYAEAESQAGGALGSLSTYNALYYRRGNELALSTEPSGSDTLAGVESYDGSQSVEALTAVPASSPLSGNVRAEMPPAVGNSVAEVLDMRMRTYGTFTHDDLGANPETKGYGRPDGASFADTVFTLDAHQAGTSTVVEVLETPALVCLDVTGLTDPHVLYYDVPDNSWRNARQTCIDYPIEAAEGVVTSVAEGLTFEAPFWDHTANRLCTWICHLTEFAVFDATATTTGDPHFEGFRGGWYDFMGEAGKVFNLFTDTTLHVNARFVDYSELPGQTYMGEIGILAGPHRIAMAADGTVRVPDVPDCVLVNPARPNHCALRGGGYVRWSDDKLELEWDVYRLSLTTEVWTFAHTDAEAHGLGYRMAVNHAALERSGRAETWAPHGVHGQVAGVQHVVVGAGKQGEGVVAGHFRDYEVASGDLFGVDVMHAQWSADAESGAMESEDTAEWVEARAQ